MPIPFTNVHLHVFNSKCAPDNFLRIIPKKFVRKHPGTVKKVLESKGSRKIIHKLFDWTHQRSPNKQREFGKYIAFLDVATEASQLEVFQTAFDAGRSFDPEIRLVGLTLNMDYMDSAPSNHIRYETQLSKVMEIKGFYPANFFPFLGIDPRHRSGPELESWATPYFETGIKHSDGRAFPYFSGLKIYPALGFFPFDPALKEMYSYAESQHLPVMTHCTRVGSQYIGDQIENLIPPRPSVLRFNSSDLTADQTNANAVIDGAYTSIVGRIAEYRKRGWIKDSKIGTNDIACDLFGHPENYIPVLEMFPHLKLCLAHMGGGTEFDKETDDKVLAEIRKVDTKLWFERIKELMLIYPNLYTDISYTLSDFVDKNSAVYKGVTDLLEANSPFGKLGDRVLFGTDFFMTEQETRESELYAITRANFGTWWDRIGRDNPERFLMMPGV